MRACLVTVLLVLQACTEGAAPTNAPAPTLPAATPRHSSAIAEPEKAEQGATAGISPSGPSSSRVHVRDLWLELRDCELVYGSGAAATPLPTQLPAPCQFAKGKDGAVRIVESEAGSVLIVESSRSEAAPSPGGATSDCDTRLRGVVVTAKGVQLSRDTQKVATCAPAHWDEKMFHVFSLQLVEPSRP